MWEIKKSEILTTSLKFKISKIIVILKYESNFCQKDQPILPYIVQYYIVWANEKTDPGNQLLQLFLANVNHDLKILIKKLKRNFLLEYLKLHCS